MMLECNLKLAVGRVFLLANASKSTRKSSHGTILCGVAQGLHIAIILGVCGLERTSEHNYISCHMTYVGLLYGDIIPLKIKK